MTWIVINSVTIQLPERAHKKRRYHQTYFNVNKNSKTISLQQRSDSCWLKHPEKIPYLRKMEEFFRRFSILPIWKDICRYSFEESKEIALHCKFLKVSGKTCMKHFPYQFSKFSGVINYSPALDLSKNGENQMAKIKFAAVIRLIPNEPYWVSV